LPARYTAACNEGNRPGGPGKTSKPAASPAQQQPLPQQPLPPQHQSPAAQAEPDDMGERLANLAKLGELMNAGLLTQAEFEQQKARILGS